MKTFGSSLNIIRIHNCLTAAAAVAVGYYLSPAYHCHQFDPWAMSAVFFACGFGNILNDLSDIEADRQNHPARALPAGKITVEQGRLLAVIFFCLSMVHFFVLNNSERLILFIALALLIWYNRRLKHIAYWGNATVAFLSGLTFVMGGAAGGVKSALIVPGSLIPAVFAFLMHSVREIIKDIEDREGDVAVGSRTAPIIMGIKTTLSIAYVLFLLLIAATIAVYRQGWLGQVFLYMTTFIVLLPMALQFYWIGSSPTSKRCKMVSLLLKLEMIAGLLALILGKNY